MKRPAFQFYPADWRKDAAVQSCSIAAKGLWHEMLCIMHECEPYGVLTVNGRPMTPDQLARLTGVAPKDCVKLLAELEENAVFSRDEDGAIYSRRMVRDETLRAKRATGGQGGAEHGHKGAEHGVKGAEHGKKGGRPRNDGTVPGSQRGPLRVVSNGSEPPDSDALDPPA